MLVIHWLKRLSLSLAGGIGAAALVALVEGRAAYGTGDVGAQAPSYGSLVLGDAAVLAPLALLVSFVVGVAAIFLEPDRAFAPQEHLARLREQPVLARSRIAAVLPLAILTVFAWCVASANLARAALSHGTPIEAGFGLAGSSLLAFALLVPAALALLPLLRRALAAMAIQRPRWIDPAATALLALAVVALAMAWGVHAGDASGGGGGILGIFGVMKRQELDLRPVINLLAIAMGAYLLPIALGSRLRARGALISLVIGGLPLVLTAHQAFALGEHPAVASAIEHHAPLGKVALAALRHATDRDKDGASPFFAGGDCDDLDPHRSPTAIEIPSNGIDEDCSGEDLVLAFTDVVTRPRTSPPRLDPEMNLILITVDTLRIDLGFMGYEKPVTPNLDKLADKSIVFDRAYSMASYTGKSIGPLLIGKYPSETQRDGGHFNTYFAANTFLAERLKKVGVRTMGAGTHWYFLPWSGLTQGIDAWDNSATPGVGQGDSDTSITSDKLSDIGLKFLAKEENTEGRFFLWLHYFDPHQQYMPHPDAPSFAPPKAGPVAQSKAAYDAEVWFTDKHIGRLLDYVASQPWGGRTAIVFTSDHGEAFAEHGMNYHGLELWDVLVRVPLVMYVPGVRPHHVPVKRGHIDVLPTLLDIMSVELPSGRELSGKSLMPDIAAPPGADLEERDVYVDMPIGPYTGMRHALISGPTPGMKLYHVGGNQFQLFDLAADPAEKQDLSLDRSKLSPMLTRFREMRARLKEIEVPPTAPAPSQ
jgi:choline-sulfatase